MAHLSRVSAAAQRLDLRRTVRPTGQRGPQLRLHAGQLGSHPGGRGLHSSTSQLNMSRF